MHQVELRIHHLLPYRGSQIPSKPRNHQKMNYLEALAARFTKKSQAWIITFRICFVLTVFNTLLFGLYVFTPIKNPFALVYGNSASNIWFSIGTALVLGLLVQWAYDRARGYRDLAKQARGETIDSTRASE